MENSSFNHELCIHVDGSSDGTIEYLISKEINFTYSSWKGMATAYNQCFKLASHTYLLFVNDDFYFAPLWDDELIKWLKPHRVVSLAPVQPGPSPPVYDCGRTVEEFDEKKFIEYAITRPRHGLIKGIRPSTFWCALHRNVFEGVGRQKLFNWKE